MNLEFENTDWLVVAEQQKEKIINEIASQLSRERPDLFQGQSLLSGNRDKLRQ